jgi:NAD(P)-dependent dehydrogenase (short-subunit alcohol dehydrogenase family)
VTIAFRRRLGAEGVDVGRIEGLKAVVTGSGGAMGGAIATRLAEEGADIVLNDRLADRAATQETEIRRLGRDVVTVVGNVTRQEEAKRVVGAAIERWGRVDILINVVGGIKGEMANPIWSIAEEEWEFALGINLRGTFHCTQAAIDNMMSRRSGKIVNIASVAWAGEALHAHYAVAKAGVVAFTRSVATQLGPYNINVNAVAPGDTERSSGLGIAETNPADYQLSIPATGTLARKNTPLDIANAVLFLVSEESRNISGQLITVAGGSNPSL